jgi:hypothetical protein
MTAVIKIKNKRCLDLEKNDLSEWMWERPT